MRRLALIQNSIIGMPAVVQQLEMVESEGTAYTRDSLKERGGHHAFFCIVYTEVRDV